MAIATPEIFANNRPTFLEDEPQFWYRDEDGTAYPVEMEYLLPRNFALLKQTYKGDGRPQGNQVDTEDYVELPYFPGDIYFNHKAVMSKHPSFKGMKVSNQNAERNGATLSWLGPEDTVRRVSIIIYEFVYEGKVYFVKSAKDGHVGLAIADDGRRGNSTRSNLLRLYHEPSPDAGMLTAADLNPDDPANLRLMSCLATLMAARNLHWLGDKLKEGQSKSLPMDGLDRVRIDLFGMKNWAEEEC